MVIFHFHDEWRKSTLPETNIAPENRSGPKRKSLFQLSIFGGYASFRECKYYTQMLDLLDSVSWTWLQ